MATHIDSSDLVIEERIKPKKFKTGKTGWFGQKTIEIDGQKIRLNLMAFKLEK